MFLYKCETFIKNVLYVYEKCTTYMTKVDIKTYIIKILIIYLKMLAVCKKCSHYIRKRKMRMKTVDMC